MTATCCWCEAPLIADKGAWWCGNTTSDACRRRQGQHLVSVTDKKTGQLKVLYVPTPKQTVWHEAIYNRDLTRILVGGAAGPGKSKWLRETLYQLGMRVPGFHALLLRRTHKDLDQSHLRFMPHELAQRGGEWKASDRIAVFHHGKGQPMSIIRAGHLEDTNAIENYLSSEYDAIAPDELVTFDRDPMLELFSRARSTNPALFKLRGRPDADPELELDGSFVVTATNPGGRGSLWVKDFFVDHNPDPEEFPNYEPQKWAFFDARLRDNPYLKRGYEKTLLDMRESRRRQLLDGDWNVFEGAFFGEWRAATHVRTLTMEPGIEHFASMDWGFNSPGVVLWWACLPDGRYHVVREYKFQGDTAETVGKKIRTVTADLGIQSLRYIAADPAMWQKTGAGKGESIAETLLRLRLPMRRSDNDRFNGWHRVHELLKPVEDAAPWLTVDPSCKYLIRTIPAMEQDKNDPDDLDTTKDDHAVDALRYGAMSRPRPTVFREQPKPFPVGSWGWMTAQHKKPSQGVLA